MVAGTDGGADTGAPTSLIGASAPAAAPTPAAPPAAPAPPLRKAKTKEGKGKVGYLMKWPVSVYIEAK